jgi:hypothetical protein
VKRIGGWCRHLLADPKATYESSGEWTDGRGRKNARVDVELFFLSWVSLAILSQVKLPFYAYETSLVPGLYN